jgi:hypothetical protein
MVIVESIDTAQEFLRIVYGVVTAVEKAVGYATNHSDGSKFFQEYPYTSRRICKNLLRIMRKPFSQKVISCVTKKRAAEDAACMVCALMLERHRDDPTRCTGLLSHRNMTVPKLMKEVVMSTFTDEVMNRLILLRELCIDHTASKVHAFKLVLLRKKSAKSVLGELSRDIVDMICRHIKTMAEAELRQHLESAVDAAVTDNCIIIDGGVTVFNSFSCSKPVQKCVENSYITLNYYANSSTLPPSIMSREEEFPGTLL